MGLPWGKWRRRRRCIRVIHSLTSEVDGVREGELLPAGVANPRAWIMGPSTCFALGKMVADTPCLVLRATEDAKLEYDATGPRAVFCATRRRERAPTEAELREGIIAGVQRGP